MEIYWVQTSVGRFLRYPIPFPIYHHHLGWIFTYISQKRKWRLRELHMLPSIQTGEGWSWESVIELDGVCSSDFLSQNLGYPGVSSAPGTASWLGHRRWLPWWVSSAVLWEPFGSRVSLELTLQPSPWSDKSFSYIKCLSVLNTQGVSVCYSQP